MTTIQIELLEPVLDQAKKLAAMRSIPLNDYLARVITRHVASTMGVEYLEQRAKEAPTRERFLEILNNAPDVAPMPGDELPE
jgi:hypothetical protein